MARQLSRQALGTPLLLNIGETCPGPDCVQPSWFEPGAASDKADWPGGTSSEGGNRKTALFGL